MHWDHSQKQSVPVFPTIAQPAPLGHGPVPAACESQTTPSLLRLDLTHSQQRAVAYPSSRTHIRDPAGWGIRDETCCHQHMGSWRDSGPRAALQLEMYHVAGTGVQRRLQADTQPQLCRAWGLLPCHAPGHARCVPDVLECCNAQGRQGSCRRLLDARPKLGRASAVPLWSILTLKLWHRWKEGFILLLPFLETWL